MADTVKFSALSDVLERISKTKKIPLKRKSFRTFLDLHYSHRSDYFSVMRLLLPELDRDRANYGLKESVLAKCLADALGLAKGSPDADKLVNWRKGGSSVGKNAGNFALLAAEIVGSRQSQTSGGLTIAGVNRMLDHLAEVKGREDKSKVLAEFISKTNPVELKWLVMIILKDLKLGISEKTIFKEFHPDADEVYNKTCDLKLVCEKLVDPNVRYKRQDIEVGKAVRPQLASRVKNVEDAWKKMRGKRVIAECKFDGDRCQVHKDGKDVHFFSRSSIDHVEFAAAMSRVICESVKAEKCILDGELLVWNRVTNKFAEFGTINTVAKNAKEGIETDEQLCYIAFDILYLEDCSVIHQPLCERQKLLAQRVRPVPGRIELLQPGKTNSGNLLWTIAPQSAADLQKFFEMTVENREEGIVVKDFDSKWEPGDRSGKWMKLKPDYVKESELDALIIGGYYGSGRKGGGVAQYLMGIAERPSSGYPTKFLSFCKVGTGLSDEENQNLVDKLRPYFRKIKPSCYIVMSHSKETPDVWIDQPDKSVILELKSDIRKIKSEVFKSPYSLRFPRVHRVRYDKPWNECLDVTELVRMVNEDTAAGAGNGDGGDGGGRKKKPRALKKKAVKQPLLPADMLQTDVSGVKKVSDMLAGRVFFLINFKLEDKERIHKLVTEFGGKFSMNLNGDVTHVLADSPRGLVYDAATKRGDVIHPSWLLDSVAAKELLPLRPKYMLHLSYKTRELMRETLDEFGDHFFVEVDEADMKQLFGRMRSEELSVDEGDVEEKKVRFGDRSNIFGGCSFYFCYPGERAGEDGDAIIAGIVLRRLEVEVELHKGVVKTSLPGATHMIVFCDAGDAGVCITDEKVVSSRKVRVLSHAWLEEALRTGCAPPESEYDVKPVLGARLVEESPPLEEEGEGAEEEEMEDSKTPVWEVEDAEAQLMEMEVGKSVPEELPVKKKRHVATADLSAPTLMDFEPCGTTQQLDVNPATVLISETVQLPSFEARTLPETMKLPSLDARGRSSGQWRSGAVDATAVPDTVRFTALEPCSLPPAASDTMKISTAETQTIPPSTTEVLQTLKLSNPSSEADKAKVFDDLFSDFGFFSPPPEPVKKPAEAAPRAAAAAAADAPAARQEIAPRAAAAAAARQEIASKAAARQEIAPKTVARQEIAAAAPQAAAKRADAGFESAAAMPAAKKKKKSSLKDLVGDYL